MNIFKKNNILINGLLNDTFVFLQDTYNQTAAMFTVASAWGQILFVLQNLSQMILYFIEDSITELNIEQASRDSSIRSLARIAGYDPGRASTAQGEVILSWNRRESDVGGGAVIINNKSQIRCDQNGKVYSMIFGSTRVTLPLASSSSPLRVKIAQGDFQTAIVTGTGLALQSFNLPSASAAFLDQFYVDVYVNEEKWKMFDSLYDIPLNGKGFIVRTGIQEGLDVYFGNSNFGMVPQRGARIRIEYLQTSGVSGNAASTKDTPLTYRFVSTGTDLFGSEVDLNNYLVIANSIDPSFGSNPEPLNLVRLVAPKTSRSFVFANSTNYEIFLNKLGVFSQVQAFTTFDDEYLDDDNVIYIYLVPDVTLNISSNEDYFSIPVSNFLLTQQQRLSVLNLIEDSGSMIATTVVKIVEPVITRYVANVVITMFEGFDPETIRQEIRNKISDYMLNLKRRDFIPKSDMIAIIESVEGVDSVSFFFVGQKNEANQILMRSLTNVTPAQMEQQIGLNSFGDIIIGRNELVVLRGGWTDRNGINYEESITAGKPGPLNISISNIVQRGYNSGLNTDLKRQIIASSTV
jgi:hypothetical protein